VYGIIIAPLYCSANSLSALIKKPAVRTHYANCTIPTKFQQNEAINGWVIDGSTNFRRGAGL